MLVELEFIKLTLYGLSYTSSNIIRNKNLLKGLCGLFACR